MKVIRNSLELSVTASEDEKLIRLSIFYENFPEAKSVRKDKDMAKICKRGNTEVFIVQLKKCHVEREIIKNWEVSRNHINMFNIKINTHLIVCSGVNAFQCNTLVSCLK